MVAVGVYVCQALVSSKSNKGLTLNVRSTGQSRCFWPVIIRVSEDRVSFQIRKVNNKRNKGFALKIRSLG